MYTIDLYMLGGFNNLFYVYGLKRQTNNFITKKGVLIKKKKKKKHARHNTIHLIYKGKLVTIRKVRIYIRI